MKFQRIPVKEAAGAILAHSAGGKGFTFKKGRHLSQADILLLSNSNVPSIFVAWIDDDDLLENDAAQSIAIACSGSGTKTNAPFTGRCNLYAGLTGVLQIHREAINQLNSVDESITIATLPPWELVQKGQMVATVKIIPFAVSSRIVEACLTIAKDLPLVQISPIQRHEAGLILTHLEQTKQSTLDKTAAVVRTRLESLGSSLRQERRCAHHETAIATAISELLSEGCKPIFIYGASAIVDRRDVVPRGIENSGGSIDHYGMPVDPGNLLLIGHHDATPIVGLPGCARSPKLNGFDWVLWRLLANLPISSNEIQSLGVGGLLKEISLRPQQRDGIKTHSPFPRMPRIAAIVLAAGRSTRMGQANKLLMEIDGMPMIQKVVDEALCSQTEEVIVVLGHESEAIRETLTARPVHCVVNADFMTGISSSLGTGLEATSKDIDGAIILLGDMPGIDAHQINQLIAAFNPTEGRAICLPSAQGKQRNPVLWARSFFEEMMHLSGDIGARSLIDKYSDQVSEVVSDEDKAFNDIDTLQELAAFTDDD